MSLLLPEKQRRRHRLPPVLQLPSHQLPGEYYCSSVAQIREPSSIKRDIPTFLCIYFKTVCVQLETRPEQMQALMPGITNNKFPLQTLAQEVEEEEGARRPEVLFYSHPFSDILQLFSLWLVSSVHI